MYNNEINTEETVWKKRIFRTENNNNIENFESENNPDIIHINQKLKKINKRKKYKEIFHDSKPLTSVYETDSTNIFNTHKTDSSNFNKKNNLENIIKKAVNNQDYVNNPIKEKKEESISEIFNFNDLFKCKKSTKSTKNTPFEENQKSNCESCDNDNNEEGFKNLNINVSTYTDPIKNVFNVLSDYIFYLPKLIHDTTDNASKKFVKIFYKIDRKDDDKHTKDIKNDSDIIKSIIYILAMFPISIYICYNWLFLTAYKDKLYCDDNTNTKIPEEGETIIKCRPTDDNIRYEISFDDLGSTISGLFNFILDFSIQPTYWFDKIMLGNDYFPKYLNMIPFKILIKLVILIFSIGVVYAFDIYSAFNDIMFGGVITGNYNSVNIFCTTIIMWYYGYYIYEDITSQFSTKIAPLDDVSTMTSLPGVVEKGKEITEDLIEKYKNLIKWSSIPFVIVFILILKYIIRFILAVWNIGISEIVLKLFIWIHSMFGIALYGGGIGNISKNMDDIDAFVNIDLEKLSEDNPDYIEYSLFRKILIYISTFLYNNLYYFVYLIMIVSTVVASIVNIKSPSLKTVLSTLISLQGVIIVFLMFLKKKVTSIKTPQHANKYTVHQ